MKKYLLTMFIFAFAISFGLASAQTATTAGTTNLIQQKRDAFIQESKDARSTLSEERKGFKGNLKERRNLLEQEIKIKRDALLKEIQEIKKQKTTIRKSFVENRFKQVFTVIAGQQNRVSGKITELEGKGYDMTEAKANLDKAKTSLANAKTLLDSFVASQVSDTSTDASLTKPREVAKKIEASLKEARGYLVDTIKSMKSAVEGDDSEDEDN